MERPPRIRHRLPLGLLVVLGIGLAGCSGSDADLSRIPVAGRVTAGPTCPVVTTSPDPSCADRPVPGALLIVLDARGVEVARTRSAPDGRFEISLPPGTYGVVPQPVEGLMGTASEHELRLAAGSSQGELVIGYDTGIR